MGYSVGVDKANSTEGVIQMKKKNGFTIIELLVVIAVISILMGIALPRLKGMQDEGRKTRAKSETKTLQAAIESWYLNHVPHTYPETTDNLCQEYLNDASPLIVSSELLDPFTGEEYGYELSPNGLYYVVFSAGPDGVQDIVSIGNTGILAGSNNDDVFASNGMNTFE